MRTLIIISFYTVVLVHSITADVLAKLKETNRTKQHLDKDLGPLHIHVNTTKLPPEAHPVRWDDRHATLKATVLLNFVKALPELNPFNGKLFGPYDVGIPDLQFFTGNLTFENVIVTGIKELSSQNINMQLSPTRIDFNASIPDITIEADYDLDTIIGEDLLNRDSGHLKATLLDLVVTAVIGPKSVQLQTFNAYQLETTDITLDLKDVQLQMDTIYADEVKLILDEFYEKSEDLTVDNDLLNMILKAINQELAKIPATNIENYLLGTAEPGLALFGPDNRRSVRLLDLEIFASARYDIKGMSTKEYMFIDKAEVVINAREAVFELIVVQGLEEVRYVLSELLNNSLEDIMDAVLKVGVQEINKELLRMDPKTNKLLKYLRLLPYTPYSHI